MKINRPNKDIVEIFGYAPNDTTIDCRNQWRSGMCPFVPIPCVKKNHERTVVYGTCSVTTPYGDCVICPNRLYFDNFKLLSMVSKDAFGENVPFYTYAEYLKHKKSNETFVVALGMHSGHEISLKNAFSMDWVLVKISNSKLDSYTGIEVQSIDITGNYRDNWYAYKNIKENSVIPKSEHGMNWANVHKRLIPQLIRKSLIYSRSKYVKSGLYFIVPDIVYKKFEDVIGADIPLEKHKGPSIITVHTYALGENVGEGEMRSIVPVRKLRFQMEEFSRRFISGPNLPQASELDTEIMDALGLM